jgi:hypothetical protein
VSSAAEFSGHQQPSTSFSAVQLARVDRALTLVSRHAQPSFSIYLGGLGEDSHAGAQRLRDQLRPAGADSVPIAADPQGRNVDIVTGPAARARLADRGCKLAVMGEVASCKESNLLGGLLSGLRMLSDQAGSPQYGHCGLAIGLFALRSGGMKSRRKGWLAAMSRRIVLASPLENGRCR